MLSHAQVLLVSGGIDVQSGDIDRLLSSTEVSLQKISCEEM